MSRHLLGMLESSVVFQVNRNACCPPGVTSDGKCGPLAALDGAAALRLDAVSLRH
ncbi:MAG: hypothetical protein QOJ42_8114 [Acidobacteriaceae bacterium]|jgi:hypothetical protein|nr:hypothetical protein [Acidobacteriaceae bacterium]